MKKKYLITGGAGFIGTNYVSRLLERGEDVTIYDNLSRRGSDKNVEMLRQKYGNDSFQIVVDDVRNADMLRRAAQDKDVMVHLAGQVAVTTSVSDPREDFEINALGTFNVLEAARESKKDPFVLYASTNKVYGGMEDVRVGENDEQYFYKDFPLGISENHLLDFHSPYGCSKGAGDQYVRDYNRIYDVPTVVLRQSCIYGPHQFGIEDQGWVAWFVIAAILQKPIMIYGDGKQVRDILFIEDLMDAYDRCIEQPSRSAGGIYNIGGGPENTISIWRQFSGILESLLGQKIEVNYAGWRPGDQLVYVSDIRKAAKELGWKPKIEVQTGIKKLFDWVHDNKDLFLD
jgi:CDP-paratose 2-epimerase